MTLREGFEQSFFSSTEYNRKVKQDIVRYISTSSGRELSKRF